MNKPIVVIVGPTASGKSAFAIDMAQKYSGEIICADSRTVYRGMDIGTAKPPKADQAAIKHHLLDVVNPDEPFTAADFKKHALKAIDDICSRDKLPIVVGGTGLYIDALIFDYAFGPEADPKKRTVLQAMEVSELQQICSENNIPLPANTQNKRHLIRAIELGGLVRQSKRLRPQTVVVGITTDRDELRRRVEKRAHAMIDEGVLAEVAKLSEKYGWSNEALTGNIYQSLRPVLTDEVELDTALEHVITGDMQLAKRQMTWLKRNPFIVWGSPAQLAKVVEHFVQQNNLL